MPRRSIEPLEKPLTIRLEPRQAQILRAAYPALSLSAVLRSLVAKHIEILEARKQAAKKIVDEDLAG